MTFKKLEKNDTVFTLREYNGVKPLVSKKLKVLSKIEGKDSIIHFVLTGGITFISSPLLGTVGDGKGMWFSVDKEGIENVAYHIDSNRINSRKKIINSIIEKVSSTPIEKIKLINYQKKVGELVGEIAIIASSELEYK